MPRCLACQMKVSAWFEVSQTCSTHMAHMERSYIYIYRFRTKLRWCSFEVATFLNHGEGKRIDAWARKNSFFGPVEVGGWTVGPRQHTSGRDLVPECMSAYMALSLSLSLLSFNRDRHLMFMFFYQTVSIVFLFMRTIYVYKMCFSTKLVVVLHHPGHVQESWLFVNFVLAVIGCSSACSAAVHP